MDGGWFKACEICFDWIYCQLKPRRNWISTFANDNCELRVRIAEIIWQWLGVWAKTSWRLYIQLQRRIIDGSSWQSHQKFTNCRSLHKTPQRSFNQWNLFVVQTSFSFEEHTKGISNKAFVGHWDSDSHTTDCLVEFYGMLVSEGKSPWNWVMKDYCYCRI